MLSWAKSKTKTKTKWTIKEEFPTLSIQPNPVQFHAENILYSTRYERPNTLGICTYHIQNAKHAVIKSWNDMKYYPRWNVMAYSQIKDIIFFVGGGNVLNSNANYNQIISYDVKNDTVSKIDVEFEVGSHPKLILTNQDNFLHIVGGRHNSKHILFNLITNETKYIHSFEDTQPNVTEQALLHNKTSNMLLMFGGRSLQQNDTFSNTKYSSFWMYNLNKNAKMIASVYVQYMFLKAKNNKQYDILINDMIAMYLGDDMLYDEWKIYEEYRLPHWIYGFGYVLYDDRIVIVFGGQRFKSTDIVLYLDLNSKDGWKECKCKLPQAGYCHAVLIDKTVHILPYYQNTMYYTIDINGLLPSSLL